MDGPGGDTGMDLDIPVVSPVSWKMKELSMSGDI